MADEDLRKAFELLDAIPLKLGHGEPGTARLADENDPDGLVEICDSKGTPYLVMSRQDYEDIRKYKPSVYLSE